MITKKTWEILSQKQTELEQLIVQKNNSDLKNNSAIPPLVWVSRFNVRRLKLCLLVEIGEFANEIKSFKSWRKKPEIDWVKAKEELIDCLCFFSGLVAIYQIDIPPTSLVTEERKDTPFNELLLDFFAKTNDLYIEENEQFYNLESREIKQKEKNTYYEWWKTFEAVCWKLKVDESELLDTYLEKNKTNLKRVYAK